MNFKDLIKVQRFPSLSKYKITLLFFLRFIAIQKGPITMMPESDDNYGGEFCSILCLKTSPTIVVLATKNRCIHHCILLDSHDQSLESRDSQLEVGIRLGIFFPDRFFIIFLKILSILFEFPIASI